MMNKLPNLLLIKLKILIFILCLIPLVRLFYLGLNDQLGANPVEFIERSTGIWALVYLLISLSMTPLRQLTGSNTFILNRRMLGLFMFFYACLHVLTYLWIDHFFDFDEIIKDVYKHPYVLVGLSAFILSIPLAITSTKSMMKRLGGRWKILHRVVYLIGFLVILHFLWLVKKDHTEPFIYTGIFFLLLALRFIYKYRSYLKVSNFW